MENKRRVRENVGSQVGATFHRKWDGTGSGWRGGGRDSSNMYEGATLVATIRWSPRAGAGDARSGAGDAKQFKRVFL